jgi:tyrosine-protein phosphatase YwqE
MFDVQAKIQGYEKTIQTATMMKVRAETQMQQLEDERKKLLAELKEMGVTEDTLHSEIVRLDDQILEEVEKLDAWERQIKEVLG